MASGEQKWVWVKVFTEQKDDGERKAMGSAIPIERPPMVALLKEAIKVKKPNGLAHCDADELQVYPPNPDPSDKHYPTNKTKAYKGGKGDYPNAGEDNPLVVIAPPRTGGSIKTETLDKLVQSSGIADVNSNIVTRMLLTFGASVQYCRETKDFQRLRELYLATEILPSTTTKENLLIHKKLTLNGQLLPNNTSLIVCFEESVPRVLKILEEKGEAPRIHALNEAYDTMENGWTQVDTAVVPFRVFSARDKTPQGSPPVRGRRPPPRPVRQLMLMHYYPSTLAHLRQLTKELGKRLFHRMSVALQSLHEKRFAHMDVKPSNIFIDVHGEFFLGDLGSVAKFDDMTQSTVPFVPCNLDGFDRLDTNGMIKSSATVDFWMLGMTLLDVVDPDADVARNRKKMSDVRKVLRLLGVEKTFDQCLAKCL